MGASVRTLGQGSVSVNLVHETGAAPTIRLEITEHRECLPASLTPADAKALGLALVHEARECGEVVRSDDLR
jgi:hypothetical protein